MAKYVIFSVADGYLRSTCNSAGALSDAATYSYSASGASPATLSVGAHGLAISIGQSETIEVDGTHTYICDEGFIQFDTTNIPATEQVVSALMTMTVWNGRTNAEPFPPNVYQNSGIEMSSNNWVPLDTTKWVAASQIPAQPQNGGAYASYVVATGSKLHAMLMNLNPSLGVNLRMTDGDMHNAVAPSPDLANRLYAAEDRRIGFYPSGWTAADKCPVLTVYTSQRSALTTVGNSLAQISNGTWVSMRSDGAPTPTITLYYSTDRVTWTQIAIVPTGVTASTFNVAPLYGHQVLSMCVDGSDNIYVTGFRGDDFRLAAKAYTKTVGSNTWTAQILMSVTSTATEVTGGRGAAIETVWDSQYDTLVTWMVLGNTDLAGVNWVGHPVGRMLSFYSRMDLSASAARFGAGTLLRTSFVGLLGKDPVTGGGACSFTTPSTWTYRVASIVNGASEPTAMGQQKTSSGWQYQSSTLLAAMNGLRNGGSKARAVISGPATVEYITDDSAGPYVNPGCFGREQITSPTTFYDSATSNTTASQPVGSKVSQTLKWDTFYDSVFNKVWVYWLDTTDSRKLHRTSHSLATNVWFEDITVNDTVGVAGSTNVAIRTVSSPFNIGQLVIEVANINAGVHSVISISEAVLHWPYPPTLAPVPNFEKSVAQTLSWVFNDVNPKEFQSAYRLEIVDWSGTGVVMVDTGKVISTSTSYALAANLLTNDYKYQWRVTCWNSIDNVSRPDSDWQAFYTSAAPVVTIIDPLYPDTVAMNHSYDVIWTYSQIASYAQASFRVVVTRTDNGLVLSDSGVVNSQATTYRAPGLIAGVNATVAVTAISTRGVASFPKTQTLLPFSDPEKAIIEVSLVLGGVMIVITNPPATGIKPTPTHNQLWSTNLGNGLHDSPDGDPHYLTEGAFSMIADNIPINGTVYDYGVVAGASVGGPPKAESYFVRAVA